MTYIRKGEHIPRADVLHFFCQSFFAFVLYSNGYNVILRQIHDFGACLLSYKTGGGRECIFLSRDAKLDGSKAVRGGIPLVFPQFGQQDKSMPQHGFLRTNFWKADESSAYDNEESAGITFTLDLKDVKDSRGGQWCENTEYDCSCSYHVKITGKTISSRIEIKNTGDKKFPFQTLLHTYYLVDGKAALDGSNCYVKGLEGMSHCVCYSKRLLHAVSELFFLYSIIIGLRF